MPSWFADLRIILRQLYKSPGFAFTAIVTLALGVGANAVVFSVLNALVLRPLALRDAGNLYFLERPDFFSNSYPDYRDLRDHNSTLAGLAAFRIASAGLDRGKNPSVAWLYEVSGNYFDVAGEQPALGRFFHASDEHGENASPYVVLSNAYWRSQFAGDPSVIGSTVQLNKHPFTVLGVAQPGFRGTELFFAPDFWVPLMNTPQIEGWDMLTSRGSRNLFLFGRVKPGVTAAQAGENVASITAQLAKAYPEDQGLSLRLVRPGLLGSMLGGPVRAFLGGVTLLAGLILLAACANLGSLFAVRAADRGKEVAIRLALGSSRKRILRQMLAEAVFLALIGGVAGVLGAAALLRWLSAWQPVPNIPFNVPVSPDATTYVVAIALSLLSGLLFGLVPLRQITRANAYQVIKGGADGAVAFRRITLRDLLLVTQIAVCALLVTASLVAVRGLIRAVHSNFGFTQQQTMIADFDLKMSGYSDAQAVVFQRRVLDIASRLPGVTNAGYSSVLPLDIQERDNFVYRDGTTDFRPPNRVADAMVYSISPGYLGAAGTALRAGRDFTWHDDANAPSVAIVNATMARQIFGSVPNALGGSYLESDRKRYRVIGVVEDGKYRTLTETPAAAMFHPSAQKPGGTTVLVVRSARPAEETAHAMETMLSEMDRALPFTLQTWTQRLNSALFPARVASIALGVMGGLGAMLAITGIFGMASYAVSKRLRELGIRIALGAQRRDVLKTALGRCVQMLVIGSAVGLLLGVAASRVLALVVYQASSQDPLILGGVVIAMALLGLLAALAPARRAMSIDPVKLMREQ